MVEELAKRLAETADNDRDAARKMHDFVRDGVKFGVTPLFDDAGLQDTLSIGVGHCNPKAHLFSELCRAIGIEARMHFVLIKLRVLRGLFPGGLYPPVGHHAFVDVTIGDQKMATDSFIVDRPLFDVALAMLKREGQDQGYGIHVDGCADWDAKGSAFAQFANRSMLLDDFGPVEDPNEFYASRDCRNRFAGVRFGKWMAPLWPFARTVTPLINTRIEALRAPSAV